MKIYRKDITDSKTAGIWVMGAPRIHEGKLPFFLASCVYTGWDSRRFWKAIELSRDFRRHSAGRHWHTDPVRVRDIGEYAVIPTETPERPSTVTMNPHAKAP